MRPLTTLAAIALLLGTGACAATYDAAHLGVPISLADAQSPAPTGGGGTPFSVTKHPVYVMWGLMSASQPSLDDLLSGQLGAGAGLAQVKIHTRMRWSDLLITVLSAGFLSPRSVTFEGVVIPATTAGQTAR